MTLANTKGVTFEFSAGRMRITAFGGTLLHVPYDTASAWVDAWRIKKVLRFGNLPWPTPH